MARYRDGNKTDRADAKALLEAARNQALSRVPVKSVEQQAVVALHRLRQGYLQTRTARINAVRGHLREFGCPIPVGAHHVLPRAGAALAEDTVPAFLRPAMISASGPRRWRRGAAKRRRVALAKKLARVCWRVWREADRSNGASRARRRSPSSELLEASRRWRPV